MTIAHMIKQLLGLAPQSGYDYHCHNCERDFTYPADLSEPDCPYCDSTDLRRLTEPD